MQTNKEKLEYAIDNYTTGTIFVLAHMENSAYTFEITDDHYVDEYNSGTDWPDIWVFDKKTKQRILEDPNNGYCAIVCCKYGKVWGKIIEKGKTNTERSLEEIRDIINKD